MPTFKVEVQSSKGPGAPLLTSTVQAMDAARKAAASKPEPRTTWKTERKVPVVFPDGDTVLVMDRALPSALFGVAVATRDCSTGMYPTEQARDRGLKSNEQSANRLMVKQGIASVVSIATVRGTAGKAFVGAIVYYRRAPQVATAPKTKTVAPKPKASTPKPKAVAPKPKPKTTARRSR